LLELEAENAELRERMSQMLSKAEHVS
jgi:hypothetical protein